MRSPLPALLAIAALPALSGCLAKTALDVVTAPVRVAGKAVDLATTSRSEADAKHGREMRRREERLGKLDRQYRRHLRDCDDGDRQACAMAREDRAAIDDAMSGVPYERE